MGCKCLSSSNDFQSKLPNNRYNANRQVDNQPQQRARESPQYNVALASSNRNIDNANANNRNRLLTQRQRNIEPFLQSRCDPNFNFPIIEDQSIGVGLKKIKAFSSIIPKEEIDKRRIAFWGTRVEGNQETWQILQQICEDKELNDEDIKAYLSVGGLVPYKNCINVVFDSFGTLYEIPNYCIYYPVKYNLIEDRKNRPAERALRFYIRQGMEQIEVNASSNTLIQTLKQEISDKFPNLHDKGRTCDKIRLFFGGKELKEEKELWVYNLSDEAIIQFMLIN